MISEDRLLAAADDPILWAGEMDLIQRAFALQHPLEEGQVTLTDDAEAEYELVIYFARSMEQKAIGWFGIDEKAAGVLFCEPGDSIRAFHNRGVDEDLDLWTFGEDGQLLERFELDADSSTPVRPTQPYRWALETRRGALDEVDGEEVILTVAAA